MENFKKREKDLLLLVIGFIYIKILLSLTLFGSDVGSLSSIMEGIPYNEVSFSLIPFQNILKFISERDGILLVKILMMIPFGYLLANSFKTKSVVGIGLVFSILLEGIQYIVHAGNFETDTIILYMCGILLGCVIYRTIQGSGGSKTYLNTVFIIGIFLFTFNSFLNNWTNKIQPLKWKDWSGQIVDTSVELGEYSIDEADFSGLLIDVDEDKNSFELRGAEEFKKFSFADEVTVFSILEFEDEVGKVGYSVQDFAKSYGDYDADSAINFISAYGHSDINFYDGNDIDLLIWLDDFGKVEAIGAKSVMYRGVLK